MSETPARPPAPPAPAGEGAERLDAAGRALADALKVSFGLLRLILAALIVIFALSGVFKVKEGEVAVRLHFGAPQGAAERAVFTPGGPYFAWPEPLDVIVRVPTSTQQLAVDRAFWFHVAPEDRLKTLDQLPGSNRLAPEQDGSLLTADQNVVHGQWSVSWQVTPEGAPRFIRNVSAAGEAKAMLAQSERVIRAAAEQALVQAVARSTASDFLRGNVDWDGTARAQLQATLDRLETGIRITKVNLVQATPPLAVRAAFRAVNEAETEKTRLLVDAETARARALGGAAGEACPVALAAIEYYEQTLRRGDAARAAHIDAALGGFLEGRAARECFGPLVDSEADPAAREALQVFLSPQRLAGQARETVEKARGDATDLVQALRKEAESFQARLRQYGENPQVLRDRLWQDAMNQIFLGNVERFCLPPGAKEVYLELGRDPAIRKRLEREAYEREQQEAKKARNR